MSIINRIDKRLILLPPKTGTMAIESLFRENYGNYDAYDRHKCSRVHMSLSESINHYSIDNIQEWDVYQTVRNPFTRVLSGFLHAQTMPLIKQFINHSFEEFVILLKECHHSPPDEQKIFDLNNVFSLSSARIFLHQTSYSSGYDNPTYLKLEEDFPSHLNIPKRPYKNRAYMSAEQKNEMYTEKCKDIVRELYEDDFNIMGYSKEWVDYQ